MGYEWPGFRSQAPLTVGPLRAVGPPRVLHVLLPELNPAQLQQQRPGPPMVLVDRTCIPTPGLPSTQLVPGYVGQRGEFKVIVSSQVVPERLSPVP